MAFSQSFSLGETTLNQLDVHERNIGSKAKTNVTTEKAGILTDRSKNSSTKSPVAAPQKGLEIIDESPTEKTNLHSKSIRERLKRASTSKKNERKHLRRSRSDPITRSESKGSNGSNLYQIAGFTEDYGSMFDSSMDWDESLGNEKNPSRSSSSQSRRSEARIKLDSKFEETDFDKYLKDIQTQPNNKQDNSLICLSDSRDSDQINVSEIERLMCAEEATTPNDHRETLPQTEQLKNSIEWEDSDIFQDLLISQPNVVEENDDPLADVDAECVSLQIERNQVAEDDMQSCFLEVSMHLSNLNATLSTSTNRVVSQLDASVLSTSICDRLPPDDVIEEPNQRKDLIRMDESKQVQQNKLDISRLREWGCSPSIIRAYKKKSIEQMFEWQADCLSEPQVKDGYANLLYSAPTSAGKTFVSEVLMFQTVLKRQQKVLIILPFISVVREKMYTLQDLLRSSGIRVEGFFGGYTAPGGFESADIAVCTIEKANAIVNRLLEQQSIKTLGMVVVDEVHLISDPNRGYILELLLAKVLYCAREMHENIRIVAMSATLPNADLVRNWLDAKFYTTTYRPIELRETIKIGSNIFDTSMNLIRMVSKDEEYSGIEDDQDNIAQLSIETIVSAAAVIIFCPSKDWCESLATHIAQKIYILGKSKTEIGEKIRSQINMRSIEEVKGHLRNSPAGLDSSLERTISYGVAFHHAGLTFDERDIIESAFCKSSIRVIVATSTLSSGVNLPARRVIIRSPMFGGKPMCSLTYKQMIGRAGRMGKDTEGESILICTNANARIGQELIGATLKPITSCLSTNNHTHLKRALLEIIASGVATTPSQLETFIKCTLYHSEHKFEIKYFENVSNEYKAQTALKSIPNPSLPDADEDGDMDLVEKCMRFLERYEFIRMQFDDNEQELRIVATRLGYACLASSMPPSDGFFLFSELQKARQNFVIETELHAVYLVTPLSVCYQLQDLDWLFYLDMWEKLSKSMQRVGELVGVKESFLVKAMRGVSNLDNRTLQIHKRFYTALVLNELINECPLNKVAGKYKLSRGTLQSLQQTASTFAGIVKSFCKALNWDLLALIVSQLQHRIFFGIHQDLVELMKVSVLNGQRARVIFDAGYQNLAMLSKANVLTIEKCLTDSISFDVEKRDGETNYDAEQRNKHRLLFVTGRAGLSIKEASKIIIDEARSFLRDELGVDIVNWSQSQQQVNNEPENATEIHASIDGNKRVSIQENIEPIPIQSTDQPLSTRKRKISMDKQLMSSTKKPHHDRSMENEQNSSNDSSGDSDIDRVEVDASNAMIYNDEHDDFMRQFQSGNMDVVVQQQNKLNLEIVDITSNVEQYNKFVEAFEKVSECGFALAVAKPDSFNSMRRYRCIISPEFYLYGLAISFGEPYVVHFLCLQDDEEIEFCKKIQVVRDLIARKKLTLQMHSAKAQLKTLLLGIPDINQVDCYIEDSQVAQWLIQPEIIKDFGELINLYAPKCVDLSVNICDGRAKVTTSTKIRASIKSCITRKILCEQKAVLQSMGNGSILKTFKEMEMPIQKSLLHMEKTGMAVRLSALENLNDQISDYVAELEAEIFRLHGKRFAVNSTRAVAQALKICNKNGTIARKCTRKTLQKSSHPLAKLILEHRSLHAILANSVQPLIKTVSENNRIYGNSFSFTQTGRISMHEPNLQNVAKDFHTEHIERVFSCRSAFAVKDSRCLISADFCQLELRVLAHLSQDPGLISIFSGMNDVFKSIAAKWNQVDEANVTDKMRNNTKQICYGIIYGMGITSLAIAMGCDEEEAQSLYESFHQTYPGIRIYAQKLLDQVRQNGYVTTIAGRRRYIPDINANHQQKRAQAERRAVNTTIQGSAADIAKYAILRMERNLIKYQMVLDADVSSKNNIDLVLHLHDELLYEVPAEKANQVMKILKSSMENCAKLLVPLRVKLKKGQCWATMQSIQ